MVCGDARLADDSRLRSGMVQIGANGPDEAGRVGVDPRGAVPLLEETLVQLRLLDREREDLWRPTGAGPLGELPGGVLGRVTLLRQACEAMVALAVKLADHANLVEIERLGGDGVALWERLRQHARLRGPLVPKAPHPVTGRECTRPDAAVADAYRRESEAIAAIVQPLLERAGRGVGDGGLAPRRRPTGEQIEAAVLTHCLGQIADGRQIDQLTRDGVAAAVGFAGGSVSGTRTWRCLADMKRRGQEEQRRIARMAPEDLRRLIQMDPAAREPALRQLIADQAADDRGDVRILDADDGL